MQNDIAEKLKDPLIKEDISNFIDESFKESRKTNQVFSIQEFVEVLCRNAIREYGLLADLVWDYWGIRNSKDMAYLIGEFSDIKKPDIRLRYPANSKNYFLNILSPKNIRLDPKQVNGVNSEIRIGLYLKNHIDIKG